MGFIEINASLHFMRFVLFCPCFTARRLERAYILIGACVPRALIAWWILAVGYILFVSAPDFMDLVFNNAALAFVLEFDEILYAVAVPKSIKDQIAEMEVFEWGVTR